MHSKSNSDEQSDVLFDDPASSDSVMPRDGSFMTAAALPPPPPPTPPPPRRSSFVTLSPKRPAGAKSFAQGAGAGGGGVGSGGEAVGTLSAAAAIANALDEDARLR